MIQEHIKFNHPFHKEIDKALSLNFEMPLLSITGAFQQVYGFGERYPAINQCGQIYENKVEEHFCYQGSLAYLPIPFFFIPNKIGVFINTKRVFRATIKDELLIEFDPEDDCDIYLLSGTPQEMVSDLIHLTGKTLLPPKWAFGPWMSAHRWNSEKLVNKALKTIEELSFPFTAMVLEQWSDEATFYIFNGASYKAKEGPHQYSDFDFDPNGPWPNPQKMIEKIHSKGLKLLLWQIPVIKKLEPKDLPSAQHTMDWDEVCSKKYVAQVPDESMYSIPNGHWFPGSMIPDFSNPKLIEWWFSRRKYLLDIGIDGFKTDGGEFIYRDDLFFHSGATGKTMINQYAHDYISAYHDFVSDKRVLFSRAGYTGQQSVGIQWAGDQKSTWAEFKSQFRAGLNSGLSGQTFWSFDIAGFAGDLPNVELYTRATQLGVFSPIMQFHSEPIGGQFALIDPEKSINNERTPWNIANTYNDKNLITNIRNYYWLRMNLLPHLYSEAQKCVELNHVMMKHLILEYPIDPISVLIEDQYLLANILVAPVLESKVFERKVYFPQGVWYGLFDNTKYVGPSSQMLSVKLNEVLAFVKSGTALFINVKFLDGLVSDVGNLIDNNQNYRITIYGDNGSHRIMSEQEDFTVSWDQNQTQVSGKALKKYAIDWIK